MGVHAFTKNSNRASMEAEWLIKDVLPSAVISVEAPGPTIWGGLSQCGW
ncbi:hypothetical protein [Lacrimispora xylanisolvens]